MKDSKFMRGQIWWMEGYEVHKEGGKRRPALIVSNDIINGNMLNENITIVPLTSNTERANMRTNVLINRYNRATSVAKCAEVVTIYKNQLVSYESTVDEEVMANIEEALKFGLGIEEANKPQPILEEFKKEMLIGECKKETLTEVKTPVIVTLGDYKEEKFDDPVLSSLTKNDREYVELMETEIKKQGKRIVWDAETEALFMKIYAKYGIDDAAEKFQISRTTAPTIAFRLRKKYPEFERLKSGKAAASYSK